jgi:hypothetical protein
VTKKAANDGADEASSTNSGQGLDDSAREHTGGKPAHVPDAKSRAQVESMAGMGMRQERIAEVIGCDPKTLRKYYARDLRVGKTKASVNVANALYKMATEDRVPSAAIFWLKAQEGWSDKGPAGDDEAESAKRERRPLVVQVVDARKRPAENEAAEDTDAAA